MLSKIQGMVVLSFYLRLNSKYSFDDIDGNFDEKRFNSKRMQDTIVQVHPKVKFYTLESKENLVFIYVVMCFIGRYLVKLKTIKLDELTTFRSTSVNLENLREVRLLLDLFKDGGQFVSASIPFFKPRKCRK